MSSIWNNRISVSIFGDSAGAAVGITISGLPEGEYISTEELTAFMARRNSSVMGDNPHNNSPVPHILSGIVNERTTGTSLCAFLPNSMRSVKTSAKTNSLICSGHADYTGAGRRMSFCDILENIHFADRLTLPVCFAGAICGQILQRRGIYTGAHILSIHKVKDNPFDPVNVNRDAVLSIRKKDFPVINDLKGWYMTEDIRRAAEAGESLGGVIECAAVNVPAGIGSPVFDGLKNNIAQLIFGIPGISGLEFGAGFTAARMIGSQSSDDHYVNERGYVLTKTNHHGGVIGGISSGMPITINAAVTPAVHPTDMDGDPLQISKACNVPKLVPCVEAAVNIALLSHMIDYPEFC